MNTKYKTFRGIAVLLGILLAMLLAQTASAETVFTNEFWISTVVQTNCTNGICGSGTLDCPYDGSTQDKFDHVMHYLSYDAYMRFNVTIHLLAGTYQTLHDSWPNNGWRLQNGQKLLGSGIDNTIIQLVTNAGNQSYVVGSHPSCSNVVVADLTLDGNDSPASGAVSHGGIELDGTHHVVRRVKVINTAWPDGTPEVGSIVINGNGINSEGNLIEQCEVFGLPGVRNASGIGFLGSNDGSSWISGIMRNNRVCLYNPGIQTVCAGGGYMHNTLIEGNYLKGATVGLYGETGGYTNVIIAHNVFEDCEYPVLITHSPHQNLTFCYNAISSTTSNGIAWAFWFYSEASYTNIAIIGNTVTFNGNQPVPGSKFLWAANVTGLIVANNMVEPTLGNSISGCTGVSMYNNYDLSGNFLTNLNQVASPNGTTRKTVTYTGNGHDQMYYYASYADEYIGVTGTHWSGDLFIVLPPATGHAGKDFIIADESGQLSGGMRIAILTTPPDVINGGGPSVKIQTSYAGLTAVSDGTNWFAY